MQILSISHLDIMDNLKRIKLATSLGGVTRPANQPITNTHAALSPENRAKAGISESLMRLSVGGEKVDLLIGSSVRCKNEYPK
jgi:cystathionine gamma-synthase